MTTATERTFIESRVETFDRMAALAALAANCTTVRVCAYRGTHVMAIGLFNSHLISTKSGKPRAGVRDWFIDRTDGCEAFTVEVFE